MESTSDLHPFVRLITTDRVRGAIVGSALGDAIGLYTEFLNKPMIKDAYPDGEFTLTGSTTRFCKDSHRNKFSEGSWTDDTDHALLIVLSFLHSDGKTISSLDFAARLRIWIEQGLLCLDRLPLGLGRATGSVVTSNDFLDDPKLAAFRHWRNGTFTSAPNGSLMRTHPLGVLCVHKSTIETMNTAIEFSLVTHPDPRCLVACCIITQLIKRILQDEFNDEAVIDKIVDEAAIHVEEYIAQPSYQSMATTSITPQLKDQPIESPPPPLDRGELYAHTRATSWAALELDDLRKQGYVYKCLGAAILSLRLAIRRLTSASQSHNTCVQDSHIFEDIITELILQGGDADTNATVAGALVGCRLGFSYLPSHWYEGMQNVKWLLQKTDAVIQTLNLNQCASGYIGSEDPDTNPDGGRGLYDAEQLKAREYAFMEMYLKKTIDKKTVGSTSGTNDGPSIKKIWKGVFG